MAGMAAVSNGIGLSSGIGNLITFTIESCSTLNENIRSFRSKERAVRALRDEMEDLESVLKTLHASMSNMDIGMEFLEQPLTRCRDTCQEFNQLIKDSLTHSTDEQVSIGDWLKLRYLGEDITGFKNMLAGYKGIIMIALAYANIRTTRSTKEVLDEYKELIENTRYDLEGHLQDIKVKLQSGFAEGQEASDENAFEVQRMEEERDSTYQCLKICAEVSAHIEEKAQSALPAAIMSPVSPLPEPRLPFLITADAFNSAQRKFMSSRLELQRHLYSLNSQGKNTHHRLPPSMAKQTIGQQSLEDEIESITDSLSICDRAADQENEIRRNFYEDITVGDDSQQLILSLNDLISAKRIKAGSRSTQMMGQVTPQSVGEFSRSHYHSRHSNGN